MDGLPVLPHVATARAMVLAQSQRAAGLSHCAAADVINGLVTCHVNCELEQIEAETLRPLSTQSIRSAHHTHMPDRVSPA